MEDFLKQNVNIEKIILACYVPHGEGDAVHMNRPSHGLALHISGREKYTFEGNNILYTGKNDIIFLPERSNYIVKEECQNDCYAINFKIADTVNFEPFVLNMGDLVTDKFQSAEAAFRSKSAGYEIFCKATLYSIIYAMLKEREKKYIPKSVKNMIEPAIEYIHKNYTTANINVDDLAKLCGISTTYLRNIFIDTLHTTPIKYINKLKLSRAKELILSDFYSVEKVSELCGFGDKSYFCRYFKKETGMTPTEYRRSINMPK